MPADHAQRPRFGADPKPYYLTAALLIALEFVRRAFLGYVPDDFTAYLSAADIFVAGGHPYGDEVFEVTRYDGKVYNYLPGTLWLIAPLAWLPTAAAVALDWIARVAVLAFSVRTFARRLLPAAAPQAVLLLVMFHQPLLVDVLFGNFVTYLLGAFALCVWVADRAPGPRELAAALVAGVLFAFKPFWIFTGLFVLLSARQLRAAVACCAGAALVGLLSLPFLDIAPIYLERVTSMARFYHSVALGTYASWAIPLVAIVWAAAGVVLVRRAAPDVWVWGACSLVFWPRLGTYSYLALLPVLLFLIQRLGWLKSVPFLLVYVGPLPWLLRVAPVEPAFVLEAWTSWITAWVMVVTTFVLLYRGRDAT